MGESMHIGPGLFVRDGLLLLTGGMIMGATLWLTLAALP